MVGMPLGQHALRLFLLFFRMMGVRQLVAGSDPTVSQVTFGRSLFRNITFRIARLSFPPPATHIIFLPCHAFDSLPHFLLLFILFSFTNHLLQVTVLKALEWHFSALKLMLRATEGKVHDLNF